MSSIRGEIVTHGVIRFCRENIWCLIVAFYRVPGFRFSIAENPLWTIFLGMKTPRGLFVLVIINWIRLFSRVVIRFSDDRWIVLLNQFQYCSFYNWLYQ